MKRILIILFVLLYQVVYSQESKNEIVKSFFWEVDNPVERLDSVSIVKVLKTLFEIPEGYEFVHQDIKGNNRVNEIDELGYVHERYTQYYKGIKVEGSDIRVRYLNGVFHSANGEYINASNIDASIVFSKEKAIQKAIAYIDAKEYMWENEAENNWLRTISNDEKKSFYPDAEIVICENDLDDKDTLFYVAYKINVFAKEPFRHDYVYVDAKTGKIVDIIPIMLNANGRAETRYSGVRTISTEPYNSVYQLKAYSRGGGIETYNMKPPVFDGYPKHFIDNDNNWTAAKLQSDSLA